MYYGIDKKHWDNMTEDDQRFCKFMFYVTQMTDQQREALLWRMRWEIFKDRALKVLCWPARALEWALEKLTC